LTDNTWWRTQKQLDPVQLEVLNLPLDEDFLVVGPPGSGKTNILLLRAAYLARMQRPNLAVLMFTGSLRDFVTRGAQDYRISNDKIMTIERWSRRLLREHNVKFDDIGGGTFEERREEMARRVGALLTAKPRLKGHLECVLVDEVQDCLELEVENFAECGRNVFLVGDFRQRVYRGENVLDKLEKRFVTKKLVHHYRNGHDICRVADAIGKTSGEKEILPTCNYQEDANPSKAEFFECGSEADQHAQVIAQLQQQLKAYPGELLAVACPRKEDVARCRDALERSPLRDRLIDVDDFGDVDPERVIFVSTLHDVKGLEFRAVHLVAMDKVSRLGDVQKRVAFTAVTRAKTRLSVWWTKSIPGYLEQAAEAVAPVKELGSLAELFPDGEGS